MQIHIDRSSRRAVTSWLSVGALVALCAVLAVLQYRWTGEVSRAERERLLGTLQGSLFRLSQDFNGEITSVIASLLPPLSDGEAVEADYAARFARWRESGRHAGLFQRIALVSPEGEELVLRTLDFERGVFEPASWPAGWERARERLLARMSGEMGRPSGMRPPFGDDPAPIFEIPRFRRAPFAEPGRGGRGRDIDWFVVELKIEYLRNELLPEMIHRHLGASGVSDYEIQVVQQSGTGAVVFDTTAGRTAALAEADASVALLEIDFERLMRRGGGFRGDGGRPGFRPPSRDRDGGGGPRGRGGDSGRWVMSVRHHAGSLEAVVRYARWRNLAVVAGILGLILATVLMLLRFTRRAQDLAELQMQFVAGVSHELRTPLTVIRTAAYNLRGKLGSNPAQVERYGALIQAESERLTELVEQVLQFSSARVGRVIRDREPVTPGPVVAGSVDASKAVLAQHGAVVEMQVDEDVPVILGDAVALKHAIENLIGNAAKYGTEGNNWVGVFASKQQDGGQDVLEIRVEDRGPGIPADEQKRVFDPFFRGKRAMADQVHGTGLGLSLVKGIVEAHGGTVRVESEPLKRTAFIVRIPAAPGEQIDEFAHSAH